MSEELKLDIKRYLTEKGVTASEPVVDALSAFLSDQIKESAKRLADEVRRRERDGEKRGD